MITLTTLLTEYLDSTKDSSAANMERGVRKINQAHKLICGSDNYWWLEKVYTINTVVSQSDYFLPVDLRKVKAVRTQTGNKMYIVQEIADPVAFDKLQYFSNNQTSTIPVYYHIFGNKIQLFPRSAAIQPLYIEYIARPIDMTQQDYTKGMTNVLTQGDETVTGTSTTWSTDNIKAGSYMIIDDEAYQISSVTSDTALELVEAYQGTTTTVDQPYVICDIPLVPQDFCEVLWLSATRDYYLKKEDPTVYRMYTDRYLEAEARLKSNTKQKSVENVIHVRRRYNLNPNWFPQITPTP